MCKSNARINPCVGFIDSEDSATVLENRLAFMDSEDSGFSYSFGQYGLRIQEDSEDSEEAGRDASCLKITRRER